MGSPSRSSKKKKGKTTASSSSVVKVEENEATRAEDENASVAGVYNLTESGLEYQHVKSPPTPPKDSDEFLQRFR